MEQYDDSDERKDQGNAAFELNIVLQNELNMTRWDGKIPA